eukprot:g684.t1
MPEVLVNCLSGQQFRIDVAEEDTIDVLRELIATRWSEKIFARNVCVLSPDGEVRPGTSRIDAAEVSAIVSLQSPLERDWNTHSDTIQTLPQDVHIVFVGDGREIAGKQGGVGKTSLVFRCRDCLGTGTGWTGMGRMNGSGGAGHGPGYWGSRLHRVIFSPTILLKVFGEMESLPMLSIQAAAMITVTIIGNAGSLAVVPRLGAKALNTMGLALCGLAFTAFASVYRYCHDWHTLQFCLLCAVNLALSLPNIATFMLPVLLFPRNVRSTFHGISAAAWVLTSHQCPTDYGTAEAAKVGAMVGTILFPALEDYGIPVIMFTQVQHGLPFSEDSHAHIYVDDQAVLCGLGAACSHWFLDESISVDAEPHNDQVQLQLVQMIGTVSPNARSEAEHAKDFYILKLRVAMWPLHRACRLRPRRSLRGLSLALVFAVALCASDNQRRTFIPMRALPVPGRSILPAFGALHWWSQAAAWAEEQGLPKKSLYATAEEAKAAAEKLKAAGVQANLLEEPIDIRPPVVPKDAEPSAMALDAIFQGDIGSAFNIISDIIAEAQAAIEEDGIPWEQVGPFFLGVVLLANVAQFVYPLMEEAMEARSSPFKPVHRLCTCSQLYRRMIMIDSQCQATCQAAKGEHLE